MESTPGFVSTFLNGKVLVAAWPEIAWGLLVTIELALLVVATGLLLGLFLALLRRAGLRLVNWPLVFLVDLLRAVPPLVIIVLLFFGLPSAGIELSGFVATFVALSLVLAAFAEEVFFASMRAVPHGQAEAAMSMGLRPSRVLALIILPQALRIALPSLTNRTIAIIKGTAFGSVVGVTEILGAAQSGMSLTGNPSPLLLGAAAYAVLFTPVVLLARRIETRFAVAG